MTFTPTTEAALAGDPTARASADARDAPRLLRRATARYSSCSGRGARVGHSLARTTRLGRYSRLQRAPLPTPGGVEILGTFVATTAS